MIQSRGGQGNAAISLSQGFLPHVNIHELFERFPGWSCLQCWWTWSPLPTAGQCGGWLLCADLLASAPWSASSLSPSCLLSTAIPGELFTFFLFSSSYMPFPSRQGVSPLAAAAELNISACSSSLELEAARGRIKFQHYSTAFLLFCLVLEWCDTEEEVTEIGN